MTAVLLLSNLYFDSWRWSSGCEGSPTHWVPGGRVWVFVI